MTNITAQSRLKTPVKNIMLLACAGLAIIILSFMANQFLNVAKLSYVGDSIVYTVDSSIKRMIYSSPVQM